MKYLIITMSAIAYIILGILALVVIEKVILKDDLEDNIVKILYVFLWPAFFIISFIMLFIEKLYKKFSEIIGGLIK